MGVVATAHNLRKRSLEVEVGGRDKHLEGGGKSMWRAVREKDTWDTKGMEREAV